MRVHYTPVHALYHLRCIVECLKQLVDQPSEDDATVETVCHSKWYWDVDETSMVFLILSRHYTVISPPNAGNDDSSLVTTAILAVNISFDMSSKYPVINGES